MKKDDEYTIAEANLRKTILELEKTNPEMSNILEDFRSKANRIVEDSDAEIQQILNPTFFSSIKSRSKNLIKRLRG